MENSGPSRRGLDRPRLLRKALQPELWCAAGECRELGDPVLATHQRCACEAVHAAPRAQRPLARVGVRHAEELTQRANRYLAKELTSGADKENGGGQPASVRTPST